MSLHAVVVPTLTRALRNLSAVLRQGEAHAKAKNIDPDALLQSRLIEDMLPLLRQVQAATDTAKNGVARLAAVQPPVFEDDETTFAQLYDRIDRALAYVESLGSDAFEGAQSRPVTLATRRWGEVVFDDGHAYASDFLLPNFFFHVVTAYDILRAAGVELGKLDFLGLRR